MAFEKLKVDLHVHTYYSLDSLLPPKTLFKVCRMKGINCIAVTDHNSIEGALKMKKYPMKVIVGEEITTKNGEIIGLFLNEAIPKNLSLEETVEKIKEQDGLVYVPHPFDRLRNKVKADESFWKKVDIIEVFNARTIFLEDTKKAFEFAKKNKIHFGCGSDAHTSFEIGNAYILMEEFDTKKEFLKNLSKGKLFCKKSPIIFHIFTKAVKILR